MAKDADWEQKDEYYWQGPNGWTICKVWIGGGYKYEIWQPGEPVYNDAWPTLAAAIKRYNELTS